jgi:hypothetical protein
MQLTALMGGLFSQLFVFSMLDGTKQIDGPTRLLKCSVTVLAQQVLRSSICCYSQALN